MKKTSKNGRKAQVSEAQVTFRLPLDLRKFYERRAAAERRRLSDTLRIALEDHAARLKESLQTV